MTESRFRERRSAHRDEPGGEPAAPGAEPSPGAPATPEVEISRPAAEPVSTPEPVPTAKPGPTLEPGPVAEPGPLVEPGPIPESGPDGSPAGGDAEPVADLDQLAEMEVPEPSFLELIEPHVEMALRFLGELPLTPDGERRVLPRWAKREIDLLGLLEQRTQGNLPPPEQEYLRQALDHLRTMYLKASR